MKRLLNIVFFLALASAVFAQGGFEVQKRYADSLFAAEAYFDAVTEYKRLLFFDEAGSGHFHAAYRIASAYREGARISDALRWFVRAEMVAANIEERFRAITGQVRMNILLGRYGAAESRLEEMKKNPTFTEYGKEITYWLGWTAVFEGAWDRAEALFDESGCKELAQLTEQTRDKFSSETTAALLSHILPGAGQVYAGDILSGIGSAAWNLLWGWLTVKAFSEDRVFDGFAIGSLLWLRFYYGGVQNARDAVRRNNSRAANEALHYLQNTYKGEKP